MDIKITPNRLSGKVTVPPSKSVAHRLIICAAFADGRSVIENIAPSKDIIATASAMKAFGADITLKDGKAYVDGIGEIPQKAVVDCCESGSTLRFLIPVATALGIAEVFVINRIKYIKSAGLVEYRNKLVKITSNGDDMLNKSGKDYNM